MGGPRRRDPALIAAARRLVGSPWELAVVALASLGPPRALWLATPLLWPHAQPNYKIIGVPVLPPLVAVLWAFAIPGFTLGAVVAYAVLDRIDRRRPLPAWLRAGIQPAAASHAMAVAA